MRWLISVLFISILLTGCSSSSSTSNINAELMDDNAKIISIANRTTISDLSKEDIDFMDEFLNKHYNNQEKFNSYSEKEQEIVLETVEKIEKMKKK